MPISVKLPVRRWLSVALFFQWLMRVPVWLGPVRALPATVARERNPDWATWSTNDSSPEPRRAASWRAILVSLEEGLRGALPFEARSELMASKRDFSAGENWVTSMGVLHEVQRRARAGRRRRSGFFMLFVEIRRDVICFFVGGDSLLSNGWGSLGLGHVERGH